MRRARLIIGSIGLVAALYGVLQNDRRMVWVAIAALALSVGLRIASRRRGR